MRNQKEFVKDGEVWGDSEREQEQELEVERERNKKESKKEGQRKERWRGKSRENKRKILEISHSWNHIQKKRNCKSTVEFNQVRLMFQKMCIHQLLSLRRGHLSYGNDIIMRKIHMQMW